MTHFVTRLCIQSVPRLLFGLCNSLKKNTVIGLINSNTFVPHPLICCEAKRLSSSAHSESQTEEFGEKVKFYFKMPITGEIIEAIAQEGQSVLNVGLSCKIMGGACEGAMRCTTCHVFVQEDLFDRLPEAVQDEEDMLDQAPCLKLTSRLSCQLIVTKDMEGAVFELPPITRNMEVDKNQNKK